MGQSMTERPREGLSSVLYGRGEQRQVPPLRGGGGDLTLPTPAIAVKVIVGAEGTCALGLGSAGLRPASVTSDGPDSSPGPEAFVAKTEKV